MQFLSATISPPVALVSAPTTTPPLKTAPQMVVPVLVIFGNFKLVLLAKNAFLKMMQINRFIADVLKTAIEIFVTFWHCRTEILIREPHLRLGKPYFNSFLNFLIVWINWVRCFCFVTGKIKICLSFGFDEVSELSQTQFEDLNLILTDMDFKPKNF